MKRFKAFIKGFFLMAFIIGIMPLNVYSDSISEPIIICNDGNWPPYGYKDPDNEKKCIGVSVDIISEILSRKGLESEVKTLPWKRCLAYVEFGKFHIVTDASRNPEREEKFLFSDPVYSLTHGFFYKKSNFDDSVIKTTQDVNKFRIGGVLGYNFGVYKFDVSKIDQGALDIKALIAKLRSDRLDFVIGYVEIFEAYAKRGSIDLSGLGWIEIPETTLLVFHMLFTRNEKGKKQLGIVNKGLKQLKNDGTYNKILKKYGISINKK